MILAWLGAIPLTLPALVTGDDRTRSHNYAEHQPVGQPPRLQSVGRGLSEIKLSGRLVAAFGIPELMLAALYRAMDAALILPLVFSSGNYPGKFVITELAERRDLTTSSGLGLTIGVDLTLKEYIEADPVATATARQMNAARGLRQEPVDGKR